MMSHASERFVWAVDTLAIQPHQRLLEIGCGHGVAVSLVCEKLTTGTIVAIDRSPKMIAMATRRNRAHITAGRARLEAVALHDANFGRRRFDKIFAFNVAPFWLEPEAALRIVRKQLAKGGTFYLFWDARHTAPGRAQDLVKQLAERVRLGRLSIAQTRIKQLQPVPAVCIIGR